MIKAVPGFYGHRLTLWLFGFGIFIVPGLWLRPGISVNNRYQEHKQHNPRDQTKRKGPDNLNELYEFGLHVNLRFPFQLIFGISAFLLNKVTCLCLLFPAINTNFQFYLRNNKLQCKYQIENRQLKRTCRVWWIVPIQLFLFFLDSVFLHVLDARF